MNIPLKRGITAIAVAVTLSHSITSNASDAFTSAQTTSYPFKTALLTTGVIASAWALSSNSVANDKKKHFGLSVVLGAGSETMLRSYSYTASDRWVRIASATALGTIPGFAKELSDSTFDTNDLLADVIGAFTGAFLSDLLQGPTDDQAMQQNLYITSAGSESLTINWSMEF